MRSTTRYSMRCGFALVMFSVAKIQLTNDLRAIAGVTKSLEHLVQTIPYDDATELQIALDDLQEVEKRLATVLKRQPDG